MIQCVNSLSILILILVRYIMVHVKIRIKMECEYRHSYEKQKRYLCSWCEGYFYICAGLSHHDVSGTVTNREMFVGILKVA